MSTIKVDTYLTRGGASEIAIDKLKGVTAAGSMLVVGEGGTNTTNLQQGLGKAWVNFDGTASGAAARDSLNVSTMTDRGTGKFTITFATVMGNTNYNSVASATVGGEANYNRSAGAASNATNFSYLNTFESSGNTALVDAAYTSATFHGDLA